MGMKSSSSVGDGGVVRAEVVVVGLGAGGSMAFHDLARAGRDVVALELGEAMGPGEMTRREEQMLPRLFMEGASRATEDLAIRVLQGKGVGGSTLHNTNLCKPLPKEIVEWWAHDFGLDDLLDPQLDADFRDVMDLLGVHEVPDDRVNRNNALIARGVEALGWRGGRLMHNRQGCRGSGFCELGCPNNGKQNAAKVLIPQAIRAGGRVLTGARAERVLVKRGRAAGVRAAIVDPHSGLEAGAFEVLADRVVVAASATNSAALLRASDVPDPLRLMGTNLHLHPGAYVAGVFDEEVRSWEGVPQAQECTEFLKLGPGEGPRAWIVSGAAHPGAVAGLMPGFGAQHGRDMLLYKNLAILIVMLHDESSGRVAPGRGEGVHISYSLSRGDRAQLAMGMNQAARILFAAGAREVVLPGAPPRRLVAMDELDARGLGPRDVAPHAPSLVAVHPMSTLWMGADPRRSVVNPRGEHHRVPGLFVADGSLFPTSIGGPPQIPIYTFGRRVARAVMG